MAQRLFEALPHCKMRRPNAPSQCPCDAAEALEAAAQSEAKTLKSNPCLLPQCDSTVFANPTISAWVFWRTPYLSVLFLWGPEHCSLKPKLSTLAAQHLQ